MKKFFSLCSPLCLTSLCAGLLGCMGVPMTNDVEKVIGKPFTNPPPSEKRWVTVKDQQGRVMTIIDPASYKKRGNFYKIYSDPTEPDYFKKYSEGVNTRYFINWGADGLCSYSLLVGPDDVIVSWRNEGERSASECRRP